MRFPFLLETAALRTRERNDGEGVELMTTTPRLTTKQVPVVPTLAGQAGDNKN